MRSPVLALLLIACAPVAEVDRNHADDWVATDEGELDTDAGASAATGCLDAFRTTVTWADIAGEECSSRHPLDRFLGDQISVDLQPARGGGWSLTLRFIDAEAGPSVFAATSDDGKFDARPQDVVTDTSFAQIHISGTIDGHDVIQGWIYTEEMSGACTSEGSVEARLPPLECPRG